MALIEINDEKEGIGWNTDVIQIAKTPMNVISGDIDFKDEADQLYCFLDAVCSKELFEAIKNRFVNDTVV